MNCGGDSVTNLRNIVVGVVFIGLISGVRGQEQPPIPEPRPVPTNPRAPTYTSAPFDMKATALPNGYRGNSLADLYARVTPGPKTEFETAAEYATRIEKAKPNPSEVYAFLIEAPLDSGPFITYDAESNEFELGIMEDYGVRDGFDKKLTRALTIKKELVSGRRFEVNNASGARLIVTASSSNVYAIALEGNTPGPGNERLHKIRVPISREQALTLKNRLGVLLLWQAYSGPLPQSFKGFSHVKATTSEPADTNTYYYYVRAGGLRGIVVYDLETGTVYSRQWTF
jgi:hypothetical protein